MDLIGADDIAWLHGSKAQFVTAGGSIVLILGTVGNILIMILKGRPSSRHSADAGFKVSLAVVDTLNLYFGLSRHLVYIATFSDPIDLTYASCILIFYFMYTLQFISSWVLVALNVERCVSIVNPMKRRHSLTFSVLACVAISVFFLATQCWYLFALYIVQNYRNTTLTRCGEKDSFATAFRIIYPWSNMMGNCVIPVLIFVIAHGIIIKTMWQRNRVIGLSVFRTIIRRHSTVTGTAPTSPRQSSMLTPAASTTKMVQGHERATFYLLLVMDVAFFVCTFPREVYVIRTFVGDFSYTDFRAAPLRVEYGFLSVFSYINNATNFFFYCALSKNFREDVLGLFCRGRRRRLRGTTGPGTRHYRGRPRSPDVADFFHRSHKEASPNVRHSLEDSANRVVEFAMAEDNEGSQGEKEVLQEMTRTKLSELNAEDKAKCDTLEERNVQKV